MEETHCQLVTDFLTMLWGGMATSSVNKWLLWRQDRDKEEEMRRDSGGVVELFGHVSGGL